MDGVGLTFIPTTDTLIKKLSIIALSDFWGHVLENFSAKLIPTYFFFFFINFIISISTQQEKEKERIMDASFFLNTGNILRLFVQNDIFLFEKILNNDFALEYI